MIAVDGDTGLTPIPRWRMIYIKAKFVQSNWAKGHYDVLPTLRGHDSRVSAFDSNGQYYKMDVLSSNCNSALEKIDSI